MSDSWARFDIRANVFLYFEKSVTDFMVTQVSITTLTNVKCVWDLNVFAKGALKGHTAQ